MKLRELRPGLFEFWCPACEDTHHIRTKLASIPGKLMATGKVVPFYWRFNDDLEEPTFSPSFKVTTQVGQGRAVHVCHLAINSGMLEYFPSCTHRFARTFVPLPDLPELVPQEAADESAPVTT